MVHVGYFFCFLSSRPGLSNHLADEADLWGPKLCCLSHLNVDKVKKHSDRNVVFINKQGQREGLKGINIRSLHEVEIRMWGVGQRAAVL